MLQHRIARHEFSASALLPDTFRVVAFEGHEAISQLYRFEINLVSNDPEIPFADLIDKPATLTMLRGDDPTEIDGVVVDFEQTGMHDGQTEYPYTYRAVLAPRMSRLALHSQSRIFQHLTVGEIVHKVLSDAGVDLHMMLNETYEPREYCTQYKETDLDFVQRLMEYEGIHYCFRHVDGAEMVLIRDTAADAEPIAGPPDVHYRHSAGLLSGDSAEFVGVFSAREQLVTGKTEIKDYNYRTPQIDIRGESAINPGHGVGLLSDYGIHAATVARARNLARVRNEEIETTRLVMTGEGDCQRFRTGFRFDLSEHFREGLNQTYLLTAVHHVGGQAGAAQGDDGGAAATQPTAYRNRFVCVPASAPYRPPRLTPEPKLPGVLTARVESAGGDYAPVDEFGRYHVRMPFDIGNASTAQASKAVRLAQPYTGPGYGHHFPVHKDTEMVIACVDGNVDRVLGLSTIWNGDQKSPVTSENAAQNVMRSWGKNELTFDDTKGAENIYMHGTKDHHVTIKDNEHITVGTDRSQRVGHDETLRVGHDQIQKVGKNQWIDIGADRTMTVGQALDETVGASMTLAVTTFKSETVGAASELIVGGVYIVSVGAAKSEDVGGISSESVGAAKSVSAGTTISHDAGTNYSVKSGGSYALSVGKGLTMKVADDSVVETGKNLTIKAGKKAVIEVADQLTLKCGSAEIVLKKDGSISIKGSKIDIKASGNMTLKGSQIAGN